MFPPQNENAVNNELNNSNYNYTANHKKIHNIYESVYYKSEFSSQKEIIKQPQQAETTQAVISLLTGLGT